MNSEGEGSHALSPGDSDATTTKIPVNSDYVQKGSRAEKGENDVNNNGDNHDLISSNNENISDEMRSPDEPLPKAPLKWGSGNFSDEEEEEEDYFANYGSSDSSDYSSSSGSGSGSGSDSDSSSDYSSSSDNSSNYNSSDDDDNHNHNNHRRNSSNSNNNNNNKRSNSTGSSSYCCCSNSNVTPEKKAESADALNMRTWRSCSVIKANRSNILSQNYRFQAPAAWTSGTRPKNESGQLLGQSYRLPQTPRTPPLKTSGYRETISFGSSSCSSCSSSTTLSEYAVSKMKPLRKSLEIGKQSGDPAKAPPLPLPKSPVLVEKPKSPSKSPDIAKHSEGATKPPRKSSGKSKRSDGTTKSSKKSHGSDNGSSSPGRHSGERKKSVSTEGKSKRKKSKEGKDESKKDSSDKSSGDEVKKHKRKESKSGDRKDKESKHKDGKSKAKKPKTFKAPKGIETKKLHFVTAAYSGIGRRKTNEDTHVIIEDLVPDLKPSDRLSFFAVYDGHGGSATSEACKDVVHRSIMDHPLFGTSEMPTAIRDGFAKVDERINLPEGDKSGSTAVIGFLHGRTLYVADIGDSECVIGSQEIKAGPYKSELLSKKHKPTDADEKARIEQAGGMVVFGRIYGTLAVSRGFGDFEFKQSDGMYVSCEPFVRTRHLSRNDKFVIFACDGLWDKVTYDEAVIHVGLMLGRKTPDEIVKSLYELSFGKGSLDNITIVLVIFEWS